MPNHKKTNCSGFTEADSLEARRRRRKEREESNAKTAAKVRKNWFLMGIAILLYFAVQYFFGS